MLDQGNSFFRGLGIINGSCVSISKRDRYGDYPDAEDDPLILKKRRKIGKSILKGCSEKGGWKNDEGAYPPNAENIGYLYQGHHAPLGIA